MAKSKRQMMKEKLKSRTEQSEKTKEDSGKFGSFFNIRRFFIFVPAESLINEVLVLSAQ